MQHFRLKLECGHSFENSAVDEILEPWDPKEETGGLVPYKPDYKGQLMPARCCAGSHKVLEQTAIPFLTGSIGAPVNVNAGIELLKDAVEQARQEAGVPADPELQRLGLLPKE